MNAPNTTDPSNPNRRPLSELPDFRDWAAWTGLYNATAEPFSKRGIEYQKASVEFSKLIVTNLHLINAGGLATIPALSATLLGWSNLSKSDKIYLIGLPMALFATGLLCASLCAFFTYRNYQFLALHEDRSWAVSVNHISGLNPYLADHITKNRSINLEENIKNVTSLSRSVTRNFWVAMCVGWLSAACFVSACGFTAWNMR